MLVLNNEFKRGMELCKVNFSKEKGYEHINNFIGINEKGFNLSNSSKDYFAGLHIEFKEDKTENLPFTSVNFEKLECILSSMNGSNVNFLQDNDNLNLMVNGKKKAFLPIEGNCLIDDKTEDKILSSITIKPEIFRNMLKRGLYAIAEFDEVRRVLRGVLFEIDNNILTLATADGRRLALLEEKVIAGKNITCVIPEKSVIRMIKILEKIKNNVGIFIYENRIELLCNDDTFKIKFKSSLIDGQFPNWKQAIPHNSDVDIVINKKEIYEVLKNHSKFVYKLDKLKPENEDLPTFTKLTIKNGILNVESGEKTLGMLNDDIKINSQDSTYHIDNIRFNTKFLFEAIQEVTGKEFTIKFCLNIMPIIIEDIDYKAVIMPIRLK